MLVYSRRISLVCAALAIQLSPAAAAPRLPTADNIVAHYVAAIGGRTVVDAIFSIRIHGVYTENGVSNGDAVLTRMKPFYKLVGDPEHPSSEFAEGYDGSAWEYYGDPGIILRTVGPASAATRHGLAVMGDLVDYKLMGSRLSVLGMEKIAGKNAYRLRVHMPDGFEQDEFVDTSTWLIVATRKVAPVHAFGTAVSSETRWSDYRRVNGVLFAFLNREIDIDTGKLLNQSQTTSIDVNVKFDAASFSPPSFKHTLLQILIEQIFAEREDVDAVMWSYHGFKQAFPAANTDEAMEVVGYQILKMGDAKSAIALLEANAEAYPQSTEALFGLGRAYNANGQTDRARVAFERSLAVNPENKRAMAALAALPPAH